MSTGSSNLFKLVVKALISLPPDELDIIVQIAYELMPDGTPTNEHNPTAKALLAQPPIVKAVHAAFKKASKALPKHKRKAKGGDTRKYKSKAKYVTDEERLAANAGKVQTPPLALRVTGPHTGMRAQILDILRQSTGPLSPIEIGELLDIKSGRVSAVLCDMFLHAKMKGLHRQAGRSDNRAMYLYTLDETETK